MEKERQKKTNRNSSMKWIQSDIAGFEDGATSPGVQGASRNWKNKEMDSALKPPEGA